jgi:hypothetical protein
LLVLFQAPPLAQENEERVPTNKATKQGVKANNEATMGGARRYLKMMGIKA